eukprot:scaffold308380_cov30-Tisochrysis_lutea.AAC.2
MSAPHGAFAAASARSAPLQEGAIRRPPRSDLSHVGSPRRACARSALIWDASAFGQVKRACSAPLGVPQSGRGGHGPRGRPWRVGGRARARAKWSARSEAWVKKRGVRVCDEVEAGLGKRDRREA